MSTKTNTKVKRSEDCDEKNDNSENNQQPQTRKISRHPVDLTVTDFGEQAVTTVKVPPPPLIVDKNKWQQMYNNNFSAGQTPSYCQNNHLNCHHPAEETSHSNRTDAIDGHPDASLYVDSEHLNKLMSVKMLSNGSDNKKCDFDAKGDLSGNCHVGEPRVSCSGDDHTSSGNETDDLSHSSHTNDPGNEIVDNAVLVPGSYASDYEDDYDDEYEDEEISLNSDDCVYEYRGGSPVIELEMPPVERIVVDDGQEEETDFLEMDFDPDPSSEMDGYANENGPEFFIPAGVRNEQQNNQGLMQSANPPNGAVEDNEKRRLPNGGGKEGVTTHKSYSDEENNGRDAAQRYTGAKPKKFSKLNEHKHVKSSNGEASTSRSSSSSRRNDASSTMSMVKLHGTHDSDNDHCIDCAEMDFIRKTVPGHSGRFRVCKSCTLMEAKHVKCNEKRPDSLKLFPKVDAGTSNWRDTADEFGLLAETATFSSINCDEDVIIHALDSLKLTPDHELIRQHFRAEIEADTSQLDVPDYIMHISKQNCNYKKLIGLIRRLYPCTNLEIDFYPVITTGHAACSQSFSKNDVTPINSAEITKRWNANTDMNRLARVRNKRFHNLNILGKVVNVIRNAHHRSHNKDSLESIIHVPHYYPCGYISITKKTT